LDTADEFAAAVDPQTLRRLLHDGAEIAVLDAREEGTFSHQHLLFATCLPLSRLELEAPRLLPRRDVRVVWCDGGEGLAAEAARRLRGFGYSRVAVLDGGVAAWAAAGFELYSGVHVPSKAFAEVVEHACGTPWIDAAELHRRVQAGEDLAIFDSRSFEEFHDNSIPGAVSAPGAELVYRVAPLVPSKDTLVVVNCGGRTRSIVGAQALISAGLPNRVVSLKDGTMGWHLAGLEVRKGAADRAPAPGRVHARRAAEAAERLARRLGIAVIDPAGLAARRAEQALRTLYVLDVRQPEEFLAGHLPGAISIPGGQLVQETDRWLAVWNARVVLVDDPDLVRARITAVWLRQMGWKDVAVLPWEPTDGARETGPAQVAPLGWEALGTAATAVSPGELQRLLAAGEAVVVDVGSSKRYVRGHLPGAWFAVRARLAGRLGALPAAGRIVVTSEDGRLARFAATEIAGRAGVPVGWLDGGTAAWTAEGLPLESGEERYADEADDVWYTPRERRTDREGGMRAYLEWEVALAEQVGRDPDSRIEILL